MQVDLTAVSKFNYTSAEVYQLWYDNWELLEELEKEYKQGRTSNKKWGQVIPAEYRPLFNALDISRMAARYIPWPEPPKCDVDIKPHVPQGTGVVYLGSGGFGKSIPPSNRDSGAYIAGIRRGKD